MHFERSVWSGPASKPRPADTGEVDTEGRAFENDIDYATGEGTRRNRLVASSSFGQVRRIDSPRLDAPPVLPGAVHGHPRRFGRERRLALNPQRPWLLGRRLAMDRQRLHADLRGISAPRRS